MTKADLEDWYFNPVNGALRRAFGGSGGGADGGGETEITKKIREISEMLMKTWLWRYLNEQIALLIKPQWIFDTVESLWKSMKANTTAITTEVTQRVDGDNALITKTDTYAAKTDAAIGVVADALGITVSGASVVVTRQSGLGAAVKAVETGVTQAQAAIQTEQTVRATADTAIANTVTNNYAETNGRIAQVQSTAEAAATKATAAANKIDTVQARLNASGSNGEVDPNSPIISLEQRMQALIKNDNTMLGSYTLKIDTAYNGKRYVSGFGISSEFINGTYQSQFLVNANYFAVGDSTNPNQSGIFPFIVDSSAGKVYINTAMIHQAEIDIANVTGVLTAARIQGDINTLVNVNSSVSVAINSTGWTEIGEYTIPANTINGHKPFAMLNIQGNIPGGGNALYGYVTIRTASAELCRSEGLTYTNESGGASLNTGSSVKTTEATVVIIYAKTWAKTGVVNYVGGLIGGLR